MLVVVTNNIVGLLRKINLNKYAKNILMNEIRMEEKAKQIFVYILIFASEY